MKNFLHTVSCVVFPLFSHAVIQHLNAEFWKTKQMCNLSGYTGTLNGFSQPKFLFTLVVHAFSLTYVNIYCLFFKVNRFPKSQSSCPKRHGAKDALQTNLDQPLLSSNCIMFRTLMDLSILIKQLCRCFYWVAHREPRL